MAAKPDIHPTLAEDVQGSEPPPSYEEAMGQFVTSVKETQRPEELPALSYIDIMPRLTDPGNMKNNIAPTFEKFSDIMVGANFWLRNNPGLKVWKCETVERKVDLGPVIHLDSTVHHESSYGANYYVFGVRLWLTKRHDPSSEPVQELGLVNVPPPVKEIPVTVGTGPFGMVMGMGVDMKTMPVMMGFGRRGGGMMMYTRGNYLTYENLSKAVDCYNEVVAEEPLQGAILNVETTPVKFGDTFSGREADPDVTSWSEKGKGKGFRMRRFTTILRVFYVKGPPKHEKLNMITFLPKVTKEPEWNRGPQFESFDTVLAGAQQWLRTQSGIQVVNIETREAKYSRGFGQPVTIEHESTDDIITSMLDQNLVRFLRMFYVTAPEMPSYQSTMLTSRLFVPVALGGRRFENMEQTLWRINAWMALAGQPMFSVETVQHLLSASNTVNTERADFKHSPTVGNYWLTCIRIYFPQPVQDPPPHLLPPVAMAMSSASPACHIL